jgi:hypothetical protein
MEEVEFKLNPDFISSGLKALKKLAESPDIANETKTQILEYFLRRSVSLNELAGTQSRRAENDKALITKTKNNHFAEMTQKQNSKQTLKDLITDVGKNIEYIKTTGAQMMADEDLRKSQIRSNYEKCVSEIREEFPVDEPLLASLESANVGLRERATNVTQNIKDMEDKYKERISDLKTFCEGKDVKLKDVMETRRSDLTEVDAVKKSIRDYDDKINSSKMRAGFMEKKLVESKSILESTKSALDNFCNETKSIVVRAKNQVDKLNTHKGAFDLFNDGILEVVNEV